LDGVRHVFPRMKLWATLLAAGLIAAVPVTGRAADARFSQTLTAGEFTDAGLKRLSSDQVAVLDALVRRDLANQSATSRSDPPPAARFSQRLTADERRVAGLTLLTEAELTRLDASVDQHTTARLARVLLAPPSFVPPSLRLRPAETKTAPEVHGSFSLSMGWGKGGYSERTGSMNLNYEDPVHGLSVSFGYSETHAKGPAIYRDPYIGPPLSVP
jgi:hypothetical protein